MSLTPYLKIMHATGLLSVELKLLYWASERPKNEIPAQFDSHENVILRFFS
jgi:hypothetical protein